MILNRIDGAIYSQINKTSIYAAGIKNDNRYAVFPHD